MTIQIVILNYYPAAADYSVYMAFAFLIGRFLGIDHPKAIIDKPLDWKRRILGWIALVIFIISFTPRPLYIEINEQDQSDKPKQEEKDHSVAPQIITSSFKKLYDSGINFKN